MFKDRRTIVHDEEWNDLSFVVNDDLVQNVGQKICERRSFTISEISREFPQISHILLYEVITVRLGYHKFCATCVPKRLTGAAHNTQKMTSALTFIEWPQRWRWISQSHRTSNGWQNLNFICECWN
jgi:hypothetical protein